MRANSLCSYLIGAFVCCRVVWNVDVKNANLFPIRFVFINKLVVHRRVLIRIVSSAAAKDDL